LAGTSFGVADRNYSSMDNSRFSIFNSQSSCNICHSTTSSWSQCMRKSPVRVGRWNGCSVPAFQAWRINLRRVSRASARDARFCPGRHIAGFQPAPQAGKPAPQTRARFMVLMHAYQQKGLSLNRLGGIAPDHCSRVRQPCSVVTPNECLCRSSTAIGSIVLFRLGTRVNTLFTSAFRLADCIPLFLICSPGGINEQPIDRDGSEQARVSLNANSMRCAFRRGSRAG